MLYLNILSKRLRELSSCGNIPPYVPSAPRIEASSPERQFEPHQPLITTKENNDSYTAELLKL